MAKSLIYVPAQTNPHAMTVEDCCDWLAIYKGWRIFKAPFPQPLYLAPGKPLDADCQTEHPIPATIDYAALIDTHLFTDVSEDWHYPLGNALRWKACVHIGGESGMPCRFNTRGSIELEARMRLKVQLVRWKESI